MRPKKNIVLKTILEKENTNHLKKKQNSLT